MSTPKDTTSASALQAAIACCACSALVGIAYVVRVFGMWISVDADKKNVSAFTKNSLCAVAVVVVNVQHRYPHASCVAQSLGGDGNIVEETIPAKKISPRMAARWPG